MNQIRIWGIFNQLALNTANNCYQEWNIIISNQHNCSYFRNFYKPTTKTTGESRARNQVKKKRLIWEKQSSEYVMKTQKRYRQTIGETTQEKVAWKPGWCFCSYMGTHCLRGKETVLSTFSALTKVKIKTIPDALQQVSPFFHKLPYDPCMKSC